MPFSFPEAVSDFPEAMDLVNSISEMVQKEKTAATFAERQALSEPVQRKLAALIDKVKAQVAD